MNSLLNDVKTLQALEYGLSVFLFFLVAMAYFLLLRDPEKNKTI